jgi:hypothetical protein
MQQFHTGLFTSDWHEYPPAPYRGRGWTTNFVEQKREFSIGGEWVGDQFYTSKEVIVSARNRIIAQRASDMIYSARNLLAAYNIFGMFASGAQTVSAVPDPTSPGVNDPEEEPPPIHSSPHIPVACLIAAKSSHRLKFVYALARLQISMEILSVPTIELDPTRNLNIPKSHFPEDHIRIATALTSAYSAIEELELTIRASNQNPSRIKGAWNPVVRDELEQRLLRAGINLSESFYWNLRGRQTRIELRRSPEIAKPAKWAINKLVRDGAMHVSDAIAYASFLRSTVAAHGSIDKQYLRVLSVYDVSNVQFLARRLLLESLGYWRYC